MKKYKSSKKMKGEDVNEWSNDINVPVLTKKPGVGIREYPTKEKLDGYGHDDFDDVETEKKYKKPSSKAIKAAGHEMKKNPPAILAKTAKKFGKEVAGKQKIAILLSKARKGG